jgi:hypothetical protein
MTRRRSAARVADRPTPVSERTKLIAGKQPVAGYGVRVVIHRLGKQWSPCYSL